MLQRIIEALEYVHLSAEIQQHSIAVSPERSKCKLNPDHFSNCLKLQGRIHVLSTAIWQIYRQICWETAV